MGVVEAERPPLTDVGQSGQQSGQGQLCAGHGKLSPGDVGLNLLSGKGKYVPHTSMGLRRGPDADCVLSPGGLVIAKGEASLVAGHVRALSQAADIFRAVNLPRIRAGQPVEATVKSAQLPPDCLQIHGNSQVSAAQQAVGALQYLLSQRAKDRTAALKER